VQKYEVPLSLIVLKIEAMPIEIFFSHPLVHNIALSVVLGLLAKNKELRPPSIDLLREPSANRTDIALFVLLFSSIRRCMFCIIRKNQSTEFVASFVTQIES
jgi:hypothetical protein